MFPAARAKNAGMVRSRKAALAQSAKRFFEKTMPQSKSSRRFGRNARCLPDFEAEMTVTRRLAKDHL